MNDERESQPHHRQGKDSNNPAEEVENLPVCLISPIMVKKKHQQGCSIDWVLNCLSVLIPG